MSNTPTRCIALTRELDAYIRTQVASGQFASASEVVRTALRGMIAREAGTPGSHPVVERPGPPRVAGEHTP